MVRFIRSVGCLLISGLTSFLAEPYAAAEILFERFNIGDGLAQSSVNAIVQDRHGFLWIGTQDGLNRYDGYGFEVFRHQPGEDGSLSNSTVNAILEDSAENLWIATDGGLNLYEPKQNRFKTIPHLDSEGSESDSAFVNALVETPSGTIWVATNRGLFRIDGSSGEYRLSVPSGHPELVDLTAGSAITALAVGRDNTLWIGVFGLGLVNLDLGSRTTTQYRPSADNSGSLPDHFVRAIIEDSSGTVWVGTNLGGLARLKPGDGNISRFQHDPRNPTSLPGNTVWALYEDQMGQLWIGTETGGLARFDREHDRFDIFDNDPRNPRSLSYNYVKSIVEDASGILWVGTDGGGLCKRARHQEAFEIIRHDTESHPEPSAANMVMTVVEDREGQLWIGSYGGGLSRFDRKTGDIKLFIHDPANPGSIGDDIVMTLLEHSSGDIWVGTGTHGVDRYNSKTKTFTHYRFRDRDSEGLSDDQVWSLAEDIDGGLWVGTVWGLNWMNTTTGVRRQYRNEPGENDTMSSDFVTTVFVDSAGVLWVGTDKGLNRLNRESGEFTTYRHNMEDKTTLGADYVMGITEAFGALWIGTYGGGLNHLDRSRGTFVRYTTEDGLPNPVVYGIVPDSENGLWLSTNSGLSRFNYLAEDSESIGSEPAFRNFDSRYGLQSDEFNQGAYFLSERSGEIFFGGIAGTTALFPENVGPSTSFAPPIVLTDFRVFNERVPVDAIGTNGQIILDRSLAEAKRIVLSYQENVFSFKFAALDYAIPERNLYSYMMEGFDPDWVHTDASRREPTYTNLDPGTYVFRVRASNHDLVWNSDGVAIDVIITPPFWETWWFRSLAVLLVSLLLVVALEVRTTTVTRRNRKLKEINLQLNREIGDRMRAEAEVRQLAEELEERVRLRTYELETSNSELEAFAYSVSHDLRAPLRAINGFSQLVIEGGIDALSGEQRNFLDRVRASAQRMSQLIDELLILSRITRSGMCRQTVNLSEFAHEVVEDLRTAEPERSVVVQINPELEVVGDPSLLQVAVQNLLENAWKFSRDRNPAEIEFGRIQSNEGEVFVVRDNGVGFDMAYSDKLFSPFQRLHGRHEFEGTGVGLATVLRVIRRHSGRIWAESKPGRGAAFFFTLELEYLHRSTVKTPTKTL